MNNLFCLISNSHYYEVKISLYSKQYWKYIQTQYRRSLYAEYAVCVGHQLQGGGGGGTIPVAKKKKKRTRHSHICDCSRLNANDQWSMQIIDGQLGLQQTIILIID